ncbi:MAG: acyl carrier protein [Clostridiaceae bacterium]|jgi:acyl carrier protein|nr:acyl carrier protein [Clostridiaceae bacterium]
MYEEIKAAVFEATGKNVRTLDTDFIKDLGLNSLDIVNIVVIFEKKYNINIPNRDLWDIYTVRDAISYLEKRGIAR